MLIVSYEYINTDGNVHKRTVTFTNEELFKKWVAKEERKYITGIWKVEDPATNEVYTAEELEKRVGNAYLDGANDIINEIDKYFCFTEPCIHLDDGVTCRECLVKGLREKLNEKEIHKTNG